MPWHWQWQDSQKYWNCCNGINTEIYWIKITEDVIVTWQRKRCHECPYTDHLEQKIVQPGKTNMLFEPIHILSIEKFSEEGLFSCASSRCEGTGLLSSQHKNFSSSRYPGVRGGCGYQFYKQYFRSDTARARTHNLRLRSLRTLYQYAISYKIPKNCACDTRILTLWWSRCILQQQYPGLHDG